jgi:hypothetical protein
MMVEVHHSIVRQKISWQSALKTSRSMGVKWLIQQ